jgi:hypothetical protein
VYPHLLTRSLANVRGEAIFGDYVAGFLYVMCLQVPEYFNDAGVLPSSEQFSSLY